MVSIFLRTNFVFLFSESGSRESHSQSLEINMLISIDPQSFSYHFANAIWHVIVVLSFCVFLCRRRSVVKIGGRLNLFSYVVPIYVNRIESQGNIGSISPNRVTSPDRSNSPSRSPRPTSPGILTEPTSPKSRATSWFSKTQGVIKFQHTRRPFATQVMLLLLA